MRAWMSGAGHAGEGNPPPHTSASHHKLVVSIILEREKSGEMYIVAQTQKIVFVFLYFTGRGAGERIPMIQGRRWVRALFE